MSGTRECITFRLAMSHPGDVSGLEQLIASGSVRAEEIVAVFGKTEGNGCVNDFTRAFATETLKTCLGRHLAIDAAEVGRRIPLVMSGGTEGGLSPHFLVFAARVGVGVTTEKSLAVGTAFTRPFLPEEVGRLPMVRETADAVRRAVSEAGIEAAEDVHFVQIKCPLITLERVGEARARGQSVVTEDTYASMGRSRGAAALGVAVALGEIDAARISDASIGHDYGLWSGRASTSAGVELMRCEIIALGNSAAWSGDSVIAHGVMKDAIDLPSALGVLRELGFAAAGQLDAKARTRVRAVLVKADPGHEGRIRGARHIMLDDSDIQATRHARAFVGGVLAGAFGLTDLFVSGGAEHQGPDGGGPIAVIASRA